MQPQKTTIPKAINDNCNISISIVYITIERRPFLGQFNCLFYDCFRFYNKRKVVVSILGTTKSTRSQNERLFRQSNMNFL